MVTTIIYAYNYYTNQCPADCLRHPLKNKCNQFNYYIEFRDSHLSPYLNASNFAFQISSQEQYYLNEFKFAPGLFACPGQQGNLHLDSKFHENVIEPPFKLAETYYNCKPFSSDAAITSLGIAKGNAEIAIAIIVLFFMVCLGRLGCMKKYTVKSRHVEHSMLVFTELLAKVGQGLPLNEEELEILRNLKTAEMQLENVHEEPYSNI